MGAKALERLYGELWGFCALMGLLCIHTGIVLTVFALKKVTTHPVLLKICGIVLVCVGVVGTLASWYFHRQKREKRPMFPCCGDIDDLESYFGDSFNRSEKKKHPKDRKLRRIRSMSLAPGFSTPEFKIYTDFMNSEVSGVGEVPQKQGSHQYSIYSLPQHTMLALPAMKEQKQGQHHHQQQQLQHHYHQQQQQQQQHQQQQQKQQQLNQQNDSYQLRHQHRRHHHRHQEYIETQQTYQPDRTTNTSHSHNDLQQYHQNDKQRQIYGTRQKKEVDRSRKKSQHLFPKSRNKDRNIVYPEAKFNAGNDSYNHHNSFGYNEMRNSSSSNNSTPLPLVGHGTGNNTPNPTHQGHCLV